MFQQKIFREDKKNEFKALVDAWLESKKTKEQIENAKKLLSDIDISSNNKFVYEFNYAGSRDACKFFERLSRAWHDNPTPDNLSKEKEFLTELNEVIRNTFLSEKLLSTELSSSKYRESTIPIYRSSIENVYEVVCAAKKIIDIRVSNPGRSNSNTNKQQVAQINELLEEIDRMKRKIDAMSNTLDTEIKHAWFSGDLKTYKKSKLCALSNKLDVPENPTLDQIKAIFADFMTELKTCSSDTKLRQGVVSTRSKTLVDELSADVIRDKNPFKKFSYIIAEIY